MALTSVVPLQAIYPLWHPTLRRSPSLCHHSANALTDLVSVAPPVGDDLEAVLIAIPTQSMAAPHSVGANHIDRSAMFILPRQQALVSGNRMALTVTSQTEMICPIKPDQTCNPFLVYPTVGESDTGRHITPKYDADHSYFDARVVAPSYVPLICALFAGVT